MARLPCLPHHAETRIGGDSVAPERARPAAPPGQPWNRTAEIVAVCLLVLLSAAVRIHHLDYDPLWIDELITAQHSSGSFGDVLNSLRHSRPAKMPLDFLVRSAALRVRHSEAALRAPSVVFGVLAVVALYFFARAMFGNRLLAFLIALVLCFNPTAVHYSQEARFYGWTIWMAIAIADAFWRLAERPAWTTALWLFAAVSVGLLVNYLLATVVLAAGIWYVGQSAVGSLRNRDRRTVGREIALAAIPVAAAMALLMVYLLPQRGFGAADFFHQKVAWDWSLFPKFLGYVRTDFLPPVKYGAMTRRLDWWLHGLTLAGLGAGVLLWRRQIALLAAVILSYWLIALATYRIDLALTFRYVCHLAPFVLLLMVAGAFGLAEGVGRFVAKRRRALVSGSAACLFVAPLLAHQWFQFATYEHFGGPGRHQPMRDMCRFVSINSEPADSVLVDNEVYWVSFYIPKCEQATTETLKRQVESRAPFWLVVNRPQEWKWPVGIPQPSSERFSFDVIWIACFAPAGQPLPANFFERVKPVAAPNLIRDFYEKYQKAGLSAKGEEIALALSRSVPNRSQRAAALTWWASQVASRRPEQAYAVAREAIALEPSHLNLTVYATICRKAGRLEEALDAVRRAIGQEPEKGYAPGMLGMVTAWQLDRRDEARWWARYVLKHPEGYVGPKDSLADLVQARLSRLEAGGASRAADADLPAVP